MVQSAPLTSGWSIMLDIFLISAGDESRNIVVTTYQILENFLDHIPHQYDLSLLTVLLAYASQAREPEIKASAMAYVLSVALRITPVSKNMITMIAGVVTKASDAEVISFSANLFFMLVSKLPMKWEEIEAQFVMPLFSTPNPLLQNRLIADVFATLIPTTRGGCLTLLPKITDLFLRVRHVSLLESLTRELGKAATVSDGETRTVSIEMLLRILRDERGQEVLVETALAEISATSVFYSVVEVCLARAIALKTVNLVILSLTKLFAIEDGCRGTRTAEIVISSLNFAYRSGSLAVVTAVTTGVARFGFDFLKEKRFEFQVCLFQFYAHDDRKLREEIGKLAIASQDLFR
jgi:hypothetical protein